MGPLAEVGLAVFIFEEAGAAEAAGGFGFGGEGDHVWEFGAPATAFGLAGHGGVALGAAGFHGGIMASFFVGGQCGEGRWDWKRRMRTETKAPGLEAVGTKRNKGARLGRRPLQRHGGWFWFPCQLVEAGDMLGYSLAGACWAARQAGGMAMYFQYLQSLTGKLKS